MQLSEQEVVRREKLAKLRALGINPYPADLYPINSNSKEIKQQFVEGKKVIIAGRLMSINKVKPLLHSYKMETVEYKCILTVMKFVLEKIKHYIMMFLKNYLI